MVSLSYPSQSQTRVSRHHALHDKHTWKPRNVSFKCVVLNNDCLNPLSPNVLLQPWLNCQGTVLGGGEKHNHLSGVISKAKIVRKLKFYSESIQYNSTLLVVQTFSLNCSPGCCSWRDILESIFESLPMLTVLTSALIQTLKMDEICLIHA